MIKFHGPLEHLLNLSFDSGYIIPTCLKTAVIKPIFKKGDNDKLQNFDLFRYFYLFQNFLNK